MLFIDQLDRSKATCSFNGMFSIESSMRTQAPFSLSQQKETLYLAWRFFICRLTVLFRTVLFQTALVSVNALSTMYMSVEHSCT